MLRFFLIDHHCKQSEMGALLAGCSTELTSNQGNINDVHTKTAAVGRIWFALSLQSVI